MNKMNYGCEGLCVVISGGTSGIGLAAAQRFLADGARVYILGRSKERGAQALRYLDEQTGKQAVYISCDVTKQAECKAAVAKIAEQEGRPDWQLDILVNSAGFYREQRLEQMTEADFDAMMNVNVKGMMFLTQAALLSAVITAVRFIARPRVRWLRLPEPWRWIWHRACA